MGQTEDLRWPNDLLFAHCCLELLLDDDCILYLVYGRPLVQGVRIFRSERPFSTHTLAWLPDYLSGHQTMDLILWNPVLLDYTLAEGQVPMISSNAKSSYLFVYACIIIVSVTSLQVRGRLGSFNRLVHNCIAQQLCFLNSLHLFVAVTLLVCPCISDFWELHV